MWFHSNKRESVYLIFRHSILARVPYLPRENNVRNVIHTCKLWHQTLASISYFSIFNVMKLFSANISILMDFYFVFFFCCIFSNFHFFRSLVFSFLFPFVSLHFLCARTTSGPVTDPLTSAYTTATLPQYGGLYAPASLTNSTINSVAGKQIEGKFCVQKLYNEKPRSTHRKPFNHKSNYTHFAFTTLSSQIF